MSDFVKKNYLLLLTIAMIIGFFFAKIPFLKLPFYWDEAWVYGPAVRKMAIDGISMLPDGLPVYLYRGHPLLFHALNACWLDIIGNTVFSAHLFNLLIACLLIFIVYLFCKKFFDEQTGTAAAFTLCLQPVFLSQSTLVLPEVMLGFFSLLALYFFLQKKYIPYILFASAALLVKETGIAVIATSVILYVVFEYKYAKSLLSYFAGIIKISLPLVPFILFLILQKRIQGWYLFPEHVDFISFNFQVIWTKFIIRYSTFTFLLQGRNLLFFAMIISLGVMIYKRKRIPNIEIPIALLLFILIYSIIGSFNFFSKRYIFSNIPVFIILSMGITFMAFRNKYIMLGFLVIFSFVQIKYIREKNNSDHTLGFADAVKANQSMIDYCLKKNLKDRSIAVFFIQNQIMTDPLSGYIKDDEKFTHLSDRLHETEYAIITNYDSNDEFLNYRKETGPVLLKRYEYGKAWIELYRN